MSVQGAPEFDPSKPFNTCFGDGDEKYGQNGFYYDAHFNPISKQPEQIRKVTVNALKAKTERVAAIAESVSLPTELPKVVKGAKTPLISLSAARQENAAAEAAEQNAED